MWLLYGYSEATYTSRSDSTVVARFTSEQAARDYIRESELATPSRDYRYRASSLLRAYDDAWIEEDWIEGLPVNPVL
jgi:hypothetical protein